MWRLGNLAACYNELQWEYEATHLQVSHRFSQRLHHNTATETSVSVAQLVQCAFDYPAKVLLLTEQPPQHKGKALDWEDIVADQALESFQHFTPLLQ